MPVENYCSFGKSLEDETRHKERVPPGQRKLLILGYAWWFGNEAATYIYHIVYCKRNVPMACKRRGVDGVVHGKEPD
jgi:hypothetical protein